MQLNKIVIYFVLSLFTLCIIPGTQAGKVRGVTDTEIKIGILTDMSSVAAFAGTAMGQAFKDYFAYINDTGGIHGRKIKIIVEDNGYFPKTTIPAAKKLIMKDKVFAIPFCLGSSSAWSIYPIIKKERVPFLPLGADYTFYNPVKKLVFLPWPTYYNQAAHGIDWVLENNPDARIGVLYQDDAFGRDTLHGAVNAMKFYGKKLTGTEGFQGGSVDFSSQLISLRNAECDYVFLGAMVRETAQILNQAHRMGFKPRFIGHTASTNVKLANLAPLASDGFMSSTNIQTFGQTGPGMDKLLKIMNKYSGNKYSGNDHYIVAWLYCLAFAEGLRLTGPDLTVDNFIRAMERITNYDMGGLTGNITYNSKRHVGSVACKMMKFDLKKKKFIALEESWVNPKSPQLQGE